MSYHPSLDSGASPRTSFSAAGGESPPALPLRGDERADIVVIGGGILGCSLALHAAEAGARVVLLEANEIGWGASGRNSGHLPAATKHEPKTILRSLGPERGQRMIDALAGGPELVYSLAQRYRIDAAADPTGTLVAAHNQRALDRLAERAAYWQSRGAPVELLDDDAAARIIGTDFYVGAYLDRRGGGINPLAYVRGLARAAADAGATLHERSRVLRLVRSDNKWRVETESGSVHSDALFLCTNAYTDDLWPGLKQTVIPARLYQFVTKPLDAGIRSRVLVGRPVMTDTVRLILGARIHSDGRFQFNGIGPTLAQERPYKVEPAIRRVEALWPCLEGVEIDAWWSGWVAMNRDDGWNVHELAPRLYAALGCNGRGVVIATILGRDLYAHVSGAHADDLIFPFTPPTPIPLHVLHKPLVAGLLRYYRMRDYLELLPRRSAN